MPKKAKVSTGGKDIEGKTIAIVSYITWVGLIIAIILNNDKKNDFASFHIRQSLIIMIGSLLVWIPFIGWIWGIFLIILWIMGLIAAINNEKKEVPLIGGLAQDWFKGL
jgi:uncharacterized membrane protein